MLGWYSSIRTRTQPVPTGRAERLTSRTPVPVLEIVTVGRSGVVDQFAATQSFVSSGVVTWSCGKEFQLL